MKAIEVILLAPIRNLGEKDDVVKVRPGYANNFLLPQKFAILATLSNKKVIAEKLKQAGHRQNKIIDEARQLADKLQGVQLTLPTLVGKEGKIFGSVTTIQIARLLEEKGFSIDRRIIMIDENIKTLGEYTALVNLHKEVKAEVKFNVVEKQG